MEYLVNYSKRRAFWSLNKDILKINDSDNQYVVSIEEDTAYPCLHSSKTTKETSSIRRIQESKHLGIGTTSLQNPLSALVFIYKNGDAYVAALIYVDDVILVENDVIWIERTKSHLDKEFSVKDLGPLKYFLGIQVAIASEGLVLSQQKYTLDILQDSGLQGCCPSSFLMEPNLKLEKGEEEEKIDARYVHMEAALRVLQYLKTTIGQGILLPNTTETDLMAYCDVDWLGFVLRSSAEAKYRSMATAVSEIIWVRLLLKELDVAVVGPTPLFYDNQAAKHIANNLVFHERTKHVEMDFFCS
ncbi:uncharacterized mitochondrial protein-like protein [Tanacetum coccineum]